MEIEHQTIVDMILNAYTLDECPSAEEALTRWLTAHPQDLGLHELAGQIGIVKAAALERKASGTSQTMVPPLLMPTAR